MFNTIISHTLKNQDPRSVGGRTKLGVLSGTVGIICNLCLFGGKIAAGIMIHSMTVIADAFNNLSDAGSSIISLAAAKAAGKPADREHPFGHGRIEYVAALAVSFLIMEVGLTLLRSSAREIRNPGALSFSWVTFWVLVASIAVKLWLAVFNRVLGNITGSKVIRATSVDSALDCAVTGVTLLSLVVMLVTGKDIDGWTGILVSLFVISEGIGVARDTIAPLIGANSSQSEEKSLEIEKICREQKKVIDIHDLIVHDYGPGRSMATVHIELPRSMKLEEAHVIADGIEREALKRTGIMLVVHMDPADTQDKRVLELKAKTSKILSILDPQLKFHDFQVRFSHALTEVSFDLQIPFSYSRKQEEDVIFQTSSFMKEFDPTVRCQITADRGFTEEISDETGTPERNGDSVRRDGNA